MRSALYTGWMRHRRFAPRPHAFRYPLCLTYLDLDELPQLFDEFWLWSARGRALAEFRRSDYHGDPTRPLAESLRDLIATRTGVRPAGPIRLLTHLRYAGYCFNPVSFYYCFDASGSRLETIVAEITNTPWNERHAYVLPLATAERIGARVLGFELDKEFHVSPFQPMDLHYRWRFTAPAATLDVYMESTRAETALFDATLHLRRVEITAGSMARALARFPLATARVSALIYWQALRLWWRRAPFFAHPRKLRLRGSSV